MIGDADLVALERSVELALGSGDATGLRLLGQGEISLVLAAGSDPGWACKRLPPFATSSAADRYTLTIDRYVAELTGRGIRVLDTDVRRVISADGADVLYCVQPRLPAAALAVEIVRTAPERSRPLVAEIVESVSSVVDTTVGLDAQLSNWAVVDERLTYFDITTPFLRDSHGTSELDTDVFLASLPWALRAPVRRFVTPGIVERYHDPRTVTLDLAANLIKERLEQLIPTVLEAASGRFEPALTEGDVRKDYRSDARTWATLQAVRRVDRVWQRNVRRRPYPFLLPDRIER